MDRELVITIPLNEGRTPGDEASTAAYRRGVLLDLGPRLRAFREAHGVTQAEVARVVGAATPSTVTQWEVGVNVPDGMCRERLRALLAGELVPELRAAMLGGVGLPDRWARAARWYRRASRERRARATVGRAIAGVLDDLRGTAEPDALRRRYQSDDGSGVRSALVECALNTRPGRDLRRAEDAAYGLCWLELQRGVRFDLSRSLVGQLSLSGIDEAI